MPERRHAWRAVGAGRRQFLALALAGAAFPVGASADAPGRRVTYVVGPVSPMPSADTVIHTILGRLAELDLNASVRQIGTALEFTVDAAMEPELLAQVLTQQGLFAIHAEAEQVSKCEPTDPARICLPSLDGEERYRMAPIASVSSADLEEVSPTVDHTGLPAIMVRLSRSGARRFGKLTAERVGEFIALVLDGVVVIAARVQSLILGGSFTAPTNGLDAELWAAILGQPPLPAALTIYEVREASNP